MKIGVKVLIILIAIICFSCVNEKKTNQKDQQLEVDKSVPDLNEENKKTANEDLENNNKDIKDI